MPDEPDEVIDRYSRFMLRIELDRRRMVDKNLTMEQVCTWLVPIVSSCYKLLTFSRSSYNLCGPIPAWMSSVTPLPSFLVPLSLPHFSRCTSLRG
jgi:hypothetical protein